MSITEKLEVIADEVYEKGRQDEQSDFWDVYPSGNSLNNAFSYACWYDSIYKPIKTIKVSKYAYYSNLFYSSNITDTKVDIDVSDSTTESVNVFRASRLKTIKKVIVSENIAYSNWFIQCDKLENITFEGIIGENISFADSPLLTKASIINIFGCLSTTASGKTLTLNKTAVNSAFGINIDDETTYTNEWRSLINNVSNWTLSFI